MTKKPRKPRVGNKEHERSRESGDYEVGYGRPPKSGQFKAGICPNRKGRPKGSRNFMTIVRDVLSRKVPIIEQGKRKSILGLEGLLLQHLQSGLGGNLKAGAYLLNFALRILATEVEDIEEEDLSERDQEIMTNFIAQLTKKEKA